MPSPHLRHLFVCGAALAAFALAAPVGAQEFTAPPAHGLAMHGDLKYGPGFTHFEYTNPTAPKGGRVVMESTGSYDNFNPFILKGISAAGLGLLFETLTEQSLDEPFSQYGHLAAAIEVPEDRSWVAFSLRPDARWHDGRPVTAEDVVWSFNTLVEQGAPFFAAYYGDVASVEATAADRVLFRFGETVNRELPLILGEMPVLPKHWWQGRDFSQPLQEPPLGSGPYRVQDFDIGRSITYARVEDYWGRDLPVNAGRYNADLLVYEYYRDRDIATEAFKAGAFDLRAENSAKRWATSFDFPALRAGLVIQEEIPHENSAGMQGFFFNTRKPVFADRRVREAIGYAFDFEWTNKALMYDAYTRTESYFANSELSSSGLPEGAELELLEPYRDRLPDELFNAEYHPPATDGTGNPRRNLRTALKLLGEAGWTVQDKLLRNAAGDPLRFEILLVQPSLEKIVLPFTQNLAKLGIEASVRTVDPAQYQNRVNAFDFDMIVASIGQSQSPGNEQRDFWHSEKADRVGSRNLAGIRDPVIDALVAKVIQAPDRESLVAATRALDRVLLWGHYAIPHFHSRTFRVIYWNKFGKPAVSPKYGLGFPDTWWIDADRLAALQAWRQSRN